MQSGETLAAPRQVRMRRPALARENLKTAGTSGPALGSRAPAPVTPEQPNPQRPGPRPAHATAARTQTLARGARRRGQEEGAGARGHPPIGQLWMRQALPPRGGAHGGPTEPQRACAG